VTIVPDLHKVEVSTIWSATKRFDIYCNNSHLGSRRSILHPIPTFLCGGTLSDVNIEFLLNLSPLRVVYRTKDKIHVRYIDFPINCNYA
jgi:hypothetical protein